MAQVLMESGIRSEQILLEETGFDTLSSARAVCRLLQERGIQGSIIVATSGYHLPRCLILLRLLGMAVQPCRSPQGPDAVSWWQRWYWRLREVPAVPYDAALAFWLRLRGRP